MRRGDEMRWADVVTKIQARRVAKAAAEALRNTVRLPVVREILEPISLGEAIDGGHPDFAFYSEQLYLDRDGLYVAIQRDRFIFFRTYKEVRVEATPGLVERFRISVPDVNKLKKSLAA